MKKENKGIDYTKDNIYDAIGRPDLKPKADIVEDYITQEATRIVDGEFNEDGLYKRHPIYSIEMEDCTIPEGKGGGVYITMIHKREDKIKFIKDLLNEVI